MFLCRKVLWLCIKDKEKVASGKKKKKCVSLPLSCCEWKTTLKSTKCKCTWPQGSSVWRWRADVSSSWEELMSWPITVLKGRLLPHTESLSVEAARPVKHWKKRDCGLVPVPSPPWCYHHWENPRKPLELRPHQHRGDRVCSGQLDRVRITQQLGRKNRKTAQGFISILDWKKTWNEVFYLPGRRIYLSACWRCDNTWWDLQLQMIRKLNTVKCLFQSFD